MKTKMYSWRRGKKRKLRAPVRGVCKYVRTQKASDHSDVDRRNELVNISTSKKAESQSHTFT